MSEHYRKHATDAAMTYRCEGCGKEIEKPLDLYWSPFLLCHARQKDVKTTCDLCGPVVRVEEEGDE